MKDKQFLVLVKKACTQDHDAFVEICNQKAREVIFLCTREMGNIHDGEDAAQEIFIRMQKSISNLRAPEAFNVWLNRLVHNTCLNMKRDSMKHKNALLDDVFQIELPDEDLVSMPQEYVEDADKRRRLAGIIDTLPDKYRTCLILHYYQNLSYPEIAEVLDISVDSVNNNMRMARKYLRLEMEEKDWNTKGKVWAAMPLVALGPALNQSLLEMSFATVSAQSIQSCLGGAGVFSAFLAGGSTAVGGGVVVAAEATIKTVAQVALTAALVLGSVGGTVYLANQIADTQSEAPAATAGPAAVETDYSGIISIIEQADISGRIYLQGDGTADPTAQDGLSGVEVWLVDADNGSAVIQKTITGAGEASGWFAFDELPSGRYHIQVALPQGAKPLPEQGVTLTKPLFQLQNWLVSIDGNNMIEIAEEGREPLTGLDIGLEMPADIKGRIMLYSGGEELAYDNGLVPGIAMHLLDPQGKLVGVTPITEEGYYQFENPLVSQKGDYTLHLEVDETAQVVVKIDDMVVALYPGYKNV